MITNFDQLDTTPRIRGEIAEAAAETRLKEQAAATQASRDEAEARHAAAARFDAVARALPDDLIGPDPQLDALRAEHQRRERLLQKLSATNPAPALDRLILALRESLKSSKKALVDAATEDAINSDLSFPLAGAAKHQAEDDARRLEAAEAARDRLLNWTSVLLEARQEECMARQALEAALLERKRQHLRERPELARG